MVLERPFPTYPQGFPARSSTPFERRSAGALANRPASGTEIIAELGDEHVRTGRPIVYTSADSVFQIACHEDVVPVRELYEVVRGRARDPARRARGRQRDRAPVRRRVRGPTRARRGGATSRSATRADVPRPAARARRARHRRRQDRGDLRAAWRRGRRPHDRQPRWPRRLPAHLRTWTDGCCSPTSWTSTWCGVTATTSRGSPAASPRSTRPAASPGGVAARRCVCALRRPRRRSDHAGDRPLAGVLAAAGRRAARRALRRRLRDVGATAFAC